MRVYHPICLRVHPCGSVHGCGRGCAWMWAWVCMDVGVGVDGSVYCLCMSVCVVQRHRRHVERRPLMEKLDCAMLILDELVDEG